MTDRNYEPENNCLQNSSSAQNGFLILDFTANRQSVSGLLGVMSPNPLNESVPLFSVVCRRFPISYFQHTYRVACDPQPPISVFVYPHSVVHQSSNLLGIWQTSVLSVATRPSSRIVDRALYCFFSSTPSQVPKYFEEFFFQKLVAYSLQPLGWFFKGQYEDTYYLENPNEAVVFDSLDFFLHKNIDFCIKLHSWNILKKFQKSFRYNHISLYLYFSM